MSPTSYQSPLEGIDTSTPLPTTKNADGKSLTNLPPTVRSPAYDEFVAPITKAGFDFHIYYMENIPTQKQFARELHERIRRDFTSRPSGRDPSVRLLTSHPSLHIPLHALFNQPDALPGPHPVAMFEVDTFTPHTTGVLFSWLAVHRGPLSVLIHPNTGDDYRDHTELPIWMGQPWPLAVELLK
ncbi:DOPA-like domain-containing protein [Schizophyllum commune]